MSPLVPLLLVFQPTVAAPAATDNFPETWTKVRSMITTYFYAKDSRKAEMEKRMETFGPKAQGAKSRIEFADTVNSMIGEFQDSHFEFLPDFSQGYYTFDSLARGDEARKMPNIDAWFRKKGAQWEVQMVLEGGEAAKAGLRKGDLILAIDGKEFTPVTSLAEILASKKGQVQIQFKNASGSVKTAQVSVHEDTAMRMFLNASFRSIKTIEKGGKKYGYLHLWTMGSNDFREFLNDTIVNRFGKTDGLIIDVRDGFGGTFDGFGAPLWMPAIEVNYHSKIMNRTVVAGYDKQLVLIINEGSRSAKEVFSKIIKTSKRGTLVGRNTAGAVLGTTPMKVNDWSYLEIPIVELSINGDRLEDTGVAPDVFVKDEFDASGKDLFVEKALEVLANEKPGS
ncbi:MAG: PDZ domain-containing protein [Armatimonadetes bacterium]|nr:PDZ domain-containing protein [Armatimonadota bacterium]